MNEASSMGRTTLKFTAETPKQIPVSLLTAFDKSCCTQRSALVPKPKFMRSAPGKENKPAERLCLWRATRGTLIFRAALVQTACGALHCIPGREPSSCTCRLRWRGPGPRRV
jgi:hypothetical protein